VCRASGRRFPLCRMRKLVVLKPFAICERRRGLRSLWGVGVPIGNGPVGSLRVAGMGTMVVTLARISEINASGKRGEVPGDESCVLGGGCDRALKRLRVAFRQNLQSPARFGGAKVRLSDQVRASQTLATYRVAPRWGGSLRSDHR